jgi:4-amino-4-deoxychorismate lyase
VYAAPSADQSAARTTGLRVVLLDRGYRRDAGATSPWLLTGAKTLSYAVSRAALREAARRGADDVVFVSSDGWLLEGPTSSLIILSGGVLRTPRSGDGILDGTTQGDIFAWAAHRGMRTETVPLLPDHLRGADAAWLVSSGRRAAPIRSVDGVETHIDTPMTLAINEFLGTRQG